MNKQITSANDLFIEGKKIKIMGGGKLFNLSGDLFWHNNKGRIERITKADIYETKSGLLIKKINSILIDKGIKDKHDGHDKSTIYI